MEDRDFSFILSKTKVALMKKAPFFSYLVDHLKCSTGNIPTAGIDAKGNLEINEPWFLSLQPNARVGLLVHEVLHLSLEHHLRATMQSVTQEERTLWGIACDLVVNAILVENGFELPECGLIPKNGSYTIWGVTIDNLLEKAVEDVYQILKKHAPRRRRPDPNGDGESSGKEDKNGKGKTKKRTNEGDIDPNDIPKSFDEHNWKKEDIEEAKEKKELPNWRQILAEAQAIAKTRGEEPLGLDRETATVHRTKTNWRAVLRKVVTDKLPQDISYSRPNKKYLHSDLFIPTFVGEKLNVICTVDTSGSVSRDELGVFIGAIEDIARSFPAVDMVVLSHDTKVHNEYKLTTQNIEKLRKLPLNGGGGTSHVAVFEHIKKHKRRMQHAVAILLTDGYSEFPKEHPGIETVIALAGTHAPECDMPKWAHTTIIETKKA